MRTIRKSWPVVVAMAAVLGVLSLIALPRHSRGFYGSALDNLSVRTAHAGECPNKKCLDEGVPASPCVNQLDSYCASWGGGCNTYFCETD